ncbi:hypothetical protein M433DRAFT_133355 [Acidomyces richmondensis BFW]|nr:MAG: hypothetical protein FE78DRAFT_69212 [Acidomyces sp. 'richmondensis']KYG46988.1 hypothetical protein M433DRAFT_133355 [Acidomyces richmondensis BFW]
MLRPTLTTHPLHRADGSATLTTPLHTILAAVNAPLDPTTASLRLPSEAAIEIHIRPPCGVGGPKERWLETVLADLLREVILTREWPGRLVRVGLQVMRPTKGKAVGMIPGLVNAAFFALADAGVPLGGTIAGALVGISKDGEVVAEPSEKELGTCRSLHAFVFNARGDMLLCESCGDFGVKEWEGIAEQAEEVCMAAMGFRDGDEAMRDEEAGKSGPWMREELEEQARNGARWREEG